MAGGGKAGDRRGQAEKTREGGRRLIIGERWLYNADEQKCMTNSAPNVGYECINKLCRHTNQLQHKPNETPARVL